MVSMSNMGSMISRMAAEFAIDNSKTNRELAAANNELSQALLDQKNKQEEIANDIKSVSSSIQIGASATKVAEAGVKVGEETKNLADRIGSEKDLTKNVEAGQSESVQNDARHAEGGERDGEAAEKVAKTSLGNGMTVGDRFGKDGVKQILRSDVGAKMDAKGNVTETREQWDQRVGKDLQKAGFTEKEVDQIWSKAKDGKFDTQDAVNFIYDNRKPPSEAAKEDMRKKIIDTFRSEGTAFMGRQLGEMQKQHKTNGQRAGEAAERADEAASRARDNTVEVSERAGELDLKGMRQRRGAPTSAT